MKFKKSSPTTGTSNTVPGTLVPLLLALAGLAAGSALIWYFLFSHSNDRYQDDISQAYASQQVSALNQALVKLDADLAVLGSNPQLQLALQQGNGATLQLLTRHVYANSLAIYTHQPGQASTIESAEAPLSFAALDMIRRAERNMPVPVEAYQVSGTWRLYAAKAVRAPDAARTVGTLLAVFELERIVDGLPRLPADSGQVTLIQQFPGAPEQILFQRGTGYGPPIRLASSNPAWAIEFRAGPAVSAGMLNPLILFAAALLALFGLLAGLQWLQKRWSTDLQKDVATLCQVTKGHKVAGLRLGPLEPVATNILQMTKRSWQTAAPSAEAVPPAAPDNPAPPPPSQAPSRRFPPANIEENILDIDILDDEDPFDMGGATQSPASVPALPDEIFRAYDIRGVVGETLTEDIVYWLGRAIGSDSVAAGQSSILVGRDGRLSGPSLGEHLIKGLMESGCHVIDLGMVPTPVVYFATHTQETSSGVILTGSHNPSDYNGLKIVIAGETLSEERIKALQTRLQKQDLTSGAGSREQRDLLLEYQHRIVEDVALARPLRIVIDCGNGVAGVIAQSLFEELGCTVIPLHCEVDGNFPNHHPDPSKLKNLADLIEEVRSSKADIGIAFDGDADRLGVVTSEGEMIHPDRLLMLLAEDVVTRHPGADIVFDVKCSRRLPALISKLGGRPIMWKSGHSLIKSKMAEVGALLGGEMSGHIFFKERWYGFDDGLYSACRLLEILSIQPDHLSSAALLAKYPTGFTTPELNLDVGETRKFDIMTALSSQGNWGQGKVTTLDGIRVDYPHGWGLIRASNTTPMLVMRFEADKQEDLMLVQQVFRDQLATVAPDLEPNF